MVDTQVRPGENAAPAKGKSRRKLALLALLVVLLAGAAGGWYVQQAGKHPRVSAGPIDTLPPVTLNLADGHLLQVTTALQTSTATDQKAVATLQPRLLDVTIATLGSYTYSRLLPDAGRQAAKQALLSAYDAILAPVGAAAPPALLGVYFTQFLMQ